MTNSISIYQFNQNQVRTQTINGEPWFCLSDCSSALSIRQTKTDRLPQKGVTNCHILTNGGKQELTFINEPNLYRLIFRSNKPQAQAFADWVYSEVLPSIRKTGGYGTPAQVAAPMPNADLKDWCAQALALMIENRVRMAVDDERGRIAEQLKLCLTRGNPK